MDGNRPKRKTRVSACSALAVALCAAGATSAPALSTPVPIAPAVLFAPGTIGVQQAQAVAQGYWDSAPCGGGVTVSWGALAPRVNATSTWANPVDPYGAPAQNAACVITFNSAEADWTWVKLCSVMVHEYGHLTGHQHATDPNDVMYPLYQGPVKSCVTASRAVSATPTTASAVTLPSAPPAIPAAQSRSPRRRRHRHAARHHHAHHHHPAAGGYSPS